MKIQLEYDLLSGQFLYIHTGPGKQHNRTYGSLCIPTVAPNDLCIRDLGCFHLKDLQHIQHKKAYSYLLITVHRLAPLQIKRSASLNEIGTSTASSTSSSTSKTANASPPTIKTQMNSTSKSS